MAKELDYSRIANKLVLIYSGHKTDNTLSVWTKEFKDILNAQEVKRLYELFSGALCLLVSNGGRKLTWTDRANKDNFTSKWCKSVFEKHGIQTVFGPTLGPDGKALHPRTNYPHKVAMVIEQPVEQSAVEATIEQPVSKWMNVPAPEGPLESVEGPDLTRLTDGQLNMLKWHIATEENRRRIEAKKAELLKVFSEMAKDEGFSLEDLMGLI